MPHRMNSAAGTGNVFKHVCIVFRVSGRESLLPHLLKLSSQRLAVSSQWSAVSGQQSAVSGQRSAVSGLLPFPLGFFP